jgi:hypothetical protein
MDINILQRLKLHIYLDVNILRAEKTIEGMFM